MKRTDSESDLFSSLFMVRSAFSIQKRFKTTTTEHLSEQDQVACEVAHCPFDSADISSSFSKDSMTVVDIRQNSKLIVEDYSHKRGDLTQYFMISSDEESVEQIPIDDLGATCLNSIALEKIENTFIKLYPPLESSAGEYLLLAQNTSSSSLDSIISFLPGFLYFFEGIRIFPYTRLSSLASLMPTDTSKNTIEIFQVTQEPSNWEEYSTLVRTAIKGKYSDQRTHKNEGTSIHATFSYSPYDAWKYLKFVKGRDAKGSFQISNINPKIDTLEKLFQRESIPLPKSLRFDGEVLSYNRPIATLGLEDGDSIEIFY